MRRFPVMLFAAGFGTRMGEMTRTRPKPLIEVAGKALLDHALDVVAPVHPPKTVINLHYLGEQIAGRLQGRDIDLSWEKDRILETGGGLRAALPLLGDGPVMTLNTDAVWSGRNPLQELGDFWDAGRMDVLVLLAPAPKALGHDGRGDFLLGPDGRIERAAGRDGLIYLGAQILQTQSLFSVPDPVFSLNVLWDRMIAEGRAYGMVHDGGWCDVGRPEGIALAERMLSQSTHD